MMKAMLSQPMAGKTDKEIIETRERAMSELREKGYEIVNTLFTDEWYSILMLIRSLRTSVSLIKQTIWN